MPSKIKFTDKNHSFSEREIFVSQYVPGAVTLRISDNSYSGFLGFGVAITPSSCYELSLMDPLERKELLRHIDCYGVHAYNLQRERPTAPTSHINQVVEQSKHRKAVSAHHQYE